MITCLLFKLHLKLIYVFMKLNKTQNKITFISRQSNKPSLDFLMLKEALLKRDKNLNIVMLCKRSTNNNLKQILSMYPETLKQMYNLATSKAVIIDSYCLPVSILKHKKDLYVLQIWHSIGKIKKSSYQTFDKLKPWQKFFSIFMDLHKGYTNVIAAGSKFNKYYCECFRIKEDIILNYGLPRIDYLLKNQKKISKEIYNKYPELLNKKIVLYAPTFRKYEDTGYDELIKNYNPKDFVLIVKNHPNQELKHSDKVFYINDFSASDIIAISDYVITDYSSISIEAALLNKKTIYYLNDYKKYNDLNGLNIDPSIVMNNNTVFNSKELIKRINKDLYDMKEFSKYRKDYLPIELGNSTKKIVDKIMEEVK